jgi:hypothetical protein
MMRSKNHIARSDYLCCRGQVVRAAERRYTAIVVGTSTSDVLLSFRTGLQIYTEVEDEG